MFDKREWIEFGKIMNRIETEYNGTVSIISNGKGQFACVSPIFVDVENKNDMETRRVDIHVTTSDCEWFDTPYQALKFHYFYEYLEMDTSDIDVDIPPAMFTLADERGITIDELVAEVLTELMEQEPCPCGGCGCL